MARPLLERTRHIAERLTGFACGLVRVQFGAKRGRALELMAGDVAVLAAGAGPPALRQPR